MNNNAAIESQRADVESNNQGRASFPKRLAELDVADTEEIAHIVRDPSHFIEWVQSNRPDMSDLALKILDKVRYVSKKEMVDAAIHLASAIEEKAHGREVVLLADFTGRKNRKSTWLMRELAHRQSWKLEYPDDIHHAGDTTLFVFFDDASLGGARARLATSHLIEKGVSTENVLIAIAGLTKKAKDSIERDGLQVISAFQIPTIDEEFTAEEVHQVEMLSQSVGFQGGAERILTFMYHKVADNFWQPLKRSDNEEAYFVDNYKVIPPYYSNPKNV